MTSDVKTLSYGRHCAFARRTPKSHDDSLDRPKPEVQRQGIYTTLEVQRQGHIVITLLPYLLQASAVFYMLRDVPKLIEMTLAGG